MAQPKRSGLKYVVLGLVVEQPGYGYSLIKRLEQLVGAAYRLQESAVYVALNQLKADGLVRQVGRQAAGPGKRSDRVLYEATSEGQRAVAQWLGKSTGAAAPARSELVRQLSLATPEHAGGLLRGIEEAQRDCAGLLDASVRRRHELGPDVPHGWEAEVARLVHAYGAGMVTAQLAWFRDAHAMLSRFVDGGDE